MPGVQIGNGAIVASRSVISGVIPAYTIYGGNPAKFIKKRFDDALIEMLQKLQWWNFSPEKLTDILPLLCDENLENVRRNIQKMLADKGIA